MKNRSRRQPKTHFPARNDWGIPDLLPSQLAVDIPTDICIYSPAKHRYIDGKTLGFFVDDYRFEVAWSQPRKILSVIDRGWQSVCEPDFSVWRDRPFTEQLWAVYRTRWCARFWQESLEDVRILPVVNWGNQASFAFAWLGLPKRPYVVAMECRTQTIRDEKHFRRGYEQMFEYLQPQNIVCYGHPKWSIDGNITVVEPKSHRSTKRTWAEEVELARL